MEDKPDYPPDYVYQKREKYARTGRPKEKGLHPKSAQVREARRRLRPRKIRSIRVDDITYARMVDMSQREQMTIGSWLAIRMAAMVGGVKSIATLRAQGVSGKGFFQKKARRSRRGRSERMLKGLAAERIELLEHQVKADPESGDE